MAPFWEDFGHPGGVWAPLGASWGRLGVILGRLGASWGVLEPLGRLLGPSWKRLGLQNTHNINLTRHGTGSAVLSRARSCRSLMERFWIAKLPQGPERFARCARPAGFHWGFAGVLLGFRWRSWIANLPNALQIFRKILGKSSSIPPKIHPKTLQNRSQNLKKSRSGGGCDLDCFLSLFVRRLGASWGRLGASWGRLGAVLGPLWGVLGASWNRLGVSWSRLGRPRAVLGPRRGFESDF